MQLRAPIDVAKRALVMATVACRASLEVTDDPSSCEIAAQLPHWLDKHRISDALDPYERDLLLAPYGQLDKSQSRDAYWSGESAALFGWTVGVCENPPRFQLADHVAALRALKVLRSEAREILDQAALRSHDEVVDYCKEVRLTRLMIRELHVLEGTLDSSAKDMANTLGRQLIMAELANCGVEIADGDFDEARSIVLRATPAERRSVTGAYLARDVAATWLIDGRSRYFNND